MTAAARVRRRGCRGRWIFRFLGKRCDLAGRHRRIVNIHILLLNESHQPLFRFWKFQKLE